MSVARAVEQALSDGPGRYRTDDEERTQILRHNIAVLQAAGLPYYDIAAKLGVCPACIAIVTRYSGRLQWRCPHGPEPMQLQICGCGRQFTSRIGLGLHRRSCSRASDSLRVP